MIGYTAEIPLKYFYIILFIIFVLYILGWYEKERGPQD